MSQVIQQQREQSRIEKGTNWLIENISQLSQLILLMAVAYAAYKVSPGHVDITWLDQTWIISQMVALDVSAPGLARIARKEQEAGNADRATLLRRISKTLLVMGILTGAEVATFSFFPHFPEELRNIISWALMIGRVATALLYMYALHSGGKEDKSPLVQVQELTAHNQQLEAQQRNQQARYDALEARYTSTLDLQQKQGRQYVDLRDTFNTIKQRHELLVSDYDTLKAQHGDLASTHQTLVSQYTDILTHSQGLEKQVVTLTEDRDNLKNILSAISAKQVSQPAKKEVSQPQEKLSQTPVTRVSRSTKNDSKKVSHSTPVKLSRVDTTEEREAKMEEALQEMTDAGERVSARTLSDKTGYNRNITNDWLKNRNVTPQNDGENDTSETVTDDERDTGELAIVHIEKLA